MALIPRRSLCLSPEEAAPRGIYHLSVGLMPLGQPPLIAPTVLKIFHFCSNLAMALTVPCKLGEQRAAISACQKWLTNSFSA
jgi:hypothetical protein